MTEYSIAPVSLDHHSIRDEAEHHHSTGDLTSAEMDTLTGYSNEDIHAAIHAELADDDTFWSAYDQARLRVINRITDSTL